MLYRCKQIIFKYIKNKNDLIRPFMAEKWQKLHIMLLTFIQLNQLKSPLKEWKQEGRRFTFFNTLNTVEFNTYRYVIKFHAAESSLCYSCCCEQTDWIGLQQQNHRCVMFHLHVFGLVLKAPSNRYQIKTEGQKPVQLLPGNRIFSCHYGNNTEATLRGTTANHFCPPQKTPLTAWYVSVQRVDT